MATNNSLNIKSKPQLSSKEFQDLFLRKNFENLLSYFTAQNQLLDFQFFETSFSAAENNRKIAHGLGTIPQDVLVTRISGSGTVQFNWANFDASNLDVTATGACRVRFFAGSYWNFQTALANSKTDYTQVSGTVGSSSSSSNLNVASAITTYTASAANDVILCRGSSFVVNLYTPTSAGKVLTIKKTDAALTNIISLGSQNIDGFTRTLNTQGETYKLLFDGSSWQILEHFIPSNWVTYTVAGNGANWTTNCVYTGQWRRVGANLEAQITIAVSGVPGGASTDPFVSLPSGLTIDYNKLNWTLGSSSLLSNVGEGFTFYATGSSEFNLLAYVTSGTNNIRIGGLTAISTFAGTVYPFDTGPRTAIPGTYAAGGSIQMRFSVPIVGWTG